MALKISTEQLIIENKGVIRGAAYSFFSNGANGPEHIRNYGQMIGAVLFGDGEDRYLGSLEAISGSAYGYYGSDTLIGEQPERNSSATKASGRRVRGIGLQAAVVTTFSRATRALTNFSAVTVRTVYMVVSAVISLPAAKAPTNSSSM